MTSIREPTFLVDLEREARRKEAGPAMEFLGAASENRLYIALITAGEMACGASARERTAWEQLFQRFKVLEPDHEVAWRYGRAYRHLRDQGRLIGTNDLWVAATALAHAMPLVTRSADELGRVPDLEVIAY